MAGPLTPEELEAKRAALSRLGSFGRGAAQGATFGFGDEAGGALQALAGLAERQVSPGANPLAKTLDDYRQNRDSFRREDESARAANPKTFALGNLAGGLVTAPLAGGANTARAAASAGAIAGLGGSEADLTKGDVGGAAYDTAKGAATGLAIRRILQGKGLGGTVAPTTGTKMAQAGFRNQRTGAIVPTGPFHDLDALEAAHPKHNLPEYEQGFLDDAGRFYTRAEAAEAVKATLQPGRSLLSEQMFGENNPARAAYGAPVNTTIQR